MGSNTILSVEVIFLEGTVQVLIFLFILYIFNVVNILSQIQPLKGRWTLWVLSFLQMDEKGLT